MKSPQPQPPSQKVVVYLAIPGFEKMNPLAGWLLLRLIQETIDRALEDKKLLVINTAILPEAAAASQDLVSGLAKAFSPIKEKEHPETMFLDAVARSTTTPLATFTVHEGRALFTFWVADMGLGLVAVKEEIRRIGLLAFAEIGLVDLEDNVCRVYHPKDSATPFSAHCLAVIRGAGSTPPPNPPTT